MARDLLFICVFGAADGACAGYEYSTEQTERQRYLLELVSSAGAKSTSNNNNL
jgi:hypothetical protein